MVSLRLSTHVFQADNWNSCFSSRRTHKHLVWNFVYWTICNAARAIRPFLCLRSLPILCSPLFWTDWTITTECSPVYRLPLVQRRDSWICRTGICRTGNWRTKSQGWNLQDWKMTDWKMTNWKWRTGKWRSRTRANVYTAYDKVNAN